MNNPLILAVEDDVAVGYLISIALESGGYRHLLAKTGQQAISQILTQKPQIILLDLGLPDMDGVQIIKKVRSFCSVPILVISARSEDKDKIQALDAGADDYLTKPFAFAELLARIRARLRRAVAETDGDVLRVGDLEIDRLHRQVRRAGRQVELTAREFDVLALLAQWRGQPVSRDLLAREVWKVNRRLTPLDNVIDVHLSHLREKIDKDHPAKLIQTVRGVGFRLAEEGA